MNRPYRGLCLPTAKKRWAEPTLHYLTVFRKGEFKTRPYIVDPRYKGVLQCAFSGLSDQVRQ